MKVRMVTRPERGCLALWLGRLGRVAAAGHQLVAGGEAGCWDG